jgi:RND family efflux transporter MFP subunit
MPPVVAWTNVDDGDDFDDQTMVDPRAPAHTPVPFQPASFPTTPLQQKAIQRSGSIGEEAPHSQHYPQYQQPDFSHQPLGHYHQQHQHEQLFAPAAPPQSQAFREEESFRERSGYFTPDPLSRDLASLSIERDAEPGRSGRLKWIAIVAALGGAAATVFLFVIPYVTSKVFKAKVAVTEISMVSPAQGEARFTSSGYVVPVVASTISTKVAGRITVVKVRQGDVVKPGDILLELDSAEAEAALDAARAKVAAARAAAQTARVKIGEGRNQAKLAHRMAREGIGARSESVDAAARVQSLKAAARAASAEAGAIDQEVATRQADLANYTLVSPVGGTIVNKPPEIGEIIGPVFGGVASQVGGIEIADLSRLQVETDVPEARLHLVKIGSPCEVTLDAFPSERHRCRVKEIVPRVNRAKATVPVRVEFIDLVENALPEMAARVTFLAKELDAAAAKEAPKKVVPRSAVVERDGAKVVFAVENDRVRMMPVELGAELADGWVVVRGPDSGTKVVANPPAGMESGQQVQERGE